MQIGANMLNEYFDWRRGEDNIESLGIGGIIVSGEVKPSVVLRTAIIGYALSLLLGLMLVAYRGELLLVMGLLAILGGFLYTGGPRPVSSTPLGELMVMMIMGPLEIWSTMFATSGTMTPEAWIISIPVGLSVASILLANNLRDHAKDARHGRHTLPIVLGVAGGFRVLIGILLVILGWITGAVLLRQLPLPTLLIWLALPIGMQTYRKLRQPEFLDRAVPVMGRLHLAFGFLLTIGIILGGPTR